MTDSQPQASPQKRSGFYRTNLSGEASYQSFVPAPLPPNPPIELDGETTELLVAANRQIATLEELSAHIPNINLFVSMYVCKEALMSAQIEGTQATLEDILNPSADSGANRDVADVVNYIKATEYAIARRHELPLCNRLIQETHAILMKGVRGQERSPGEFRRSHNWIGGAGSTISNATFVPPVVEDMIDAMSELERYMNSNDTLDTLVRAALIHYQFETIHPFLDGNGRIGRLIVMLFLLEKNALSAPSLYPSYFLKKNRIEYYDRMMEVRNSGNYEHWVRFFLQALLESATDATEKIRQLHALHTKNSLTIDQMGRAAKSTRLLFDYLQKFPIVEIRKTAEALGMAFSTVSAAVDRLCKVGILVQSAGEQRNRMFSYAAYLELLRDGT